MTKSSLSIAVILREKMLMKRMISSYIKYTWVKAGSEYVEILCLYQDTMLANN